jgi:hypothetical protein
MSSLIACVAVTVSSFSTPIIVFARLAG